MKILIFLPDERSTWERVSSSTDLWFLRFQISQEKMLNQILSKKMLENIFLINRTLMNQSKVNHISEYSNTRNTTTYKHSKTHVR